VGMFPLLIDYSVYLLLDCRDQRLGSKVGSYFSLLIALQSINSTSVY
jgi:hypothetical protein